METLALVREIRVSRSAEGHYKVEFGLDCVDILC